MIELGPESTVMVSNFVDEAIDEAVGGSSKKWALLLIAFVVGASVALWIVSRASAGGTESAPPEEV